MSTNNLQSKLQTLEDRLKEPNSDSSMQPMQFDTRRRPNNSKHTIFVVVVVIYTALKFVYKIRC